MVISVNFDQKQHKLPNSPTSRLTYLVQTWSWGREEVWKKGSEKLVMVLKRRNWRWSVSALCLYNVCVIE